jgi:peptidoglycan hydrolase CwlO-like protein
MDVEKTMEFILEQQAQLFSGLNQLRAELGELKDVVVEIAPAQQRTNAIVETLAERHVELAARHAELAQSHADLARSHKEVAEQQKITEQSLNALISIVERHISSHN